VITIGFAGILSGPNDVWGLPQLHAVQLAISQTNAAGGILLGGVPYTITIAVADDEGDAGKAITAANKLVDAGAVAVIGHTFSGLSLAAQPVYAAAGIPMMTASSSNPLLTQGVYTNTFRTTETDAAYSRLLADYFGNWLHIQKSSIVDTNGYLMPGDNYSQVFAVSGRSITGRHAVSSSGDFTDTLQAIKLENTGAIANLFTGSTPSEYGLFSKIAYNLGMQTLPIGWSTGTNYETVLAEYSSAAGLAAAEGDYAVMASVRLSDMPGWSKFRADMIAAGYPDPDNFVPQYTAYAYDAANIIIDAIVRAGSTDPQAIRDQIAATKNFKGVVGTFQGFDTHGDVIPQWAFLEYYHNGAWTILHPTKIYLPLATRP
jgi:branched-chain amino acid transport system substrate-binding protein